MKYRVKEVRANRKSYYYPQFRFLFLWFYYQTTYTGYDYSNVSYLTLEEANNFIKKRIKANEPLCKKTIIHNYNK